MDQAVIQRNQPLLGAAKPPGRLRQRLVLWFRRAAGWLEAYPPIVEYQPLPPLKFK